MSINLMRAYHKLARAIEEQQQFEEECRQADQNGRRAHDEHIRTHLRTHFKQEVEALERQIDTHKPQQQKARAQEPELEP